MDEAGAASSGLAPTKSAAASRPGRGNAWRRTQHNAAYGGDLGGRPSARVAVPGPAVAARHVLFSDPRAQFVPVEVDVEGRRRRGYLSVPRQARRYQR